jgi:UDP:flavonoid glycosyltransferase YjiC (YdhE family)
VFVAVRVKWTEAGIDTGTTHPNPGQIRTAVQTILTDRPYQQHAQRLQRNLSQYNGLEAVALTVDSFLSQSADDMNRRPCGPT